MNETHSHNIIKHRHITFKQRVIIGYNWIPYRLQFENTQIEIIRRLLKNILKQSLCFIIKKRVKKNSYQHF